MAENQSLPEGIEKLIKNYVRSVEECDVELARGLWDSSGRVSFIHPNGYERSFEEVAEHFYKGTMERLCTKRELVVRNIACRMCSEAAFAEFEWDFYATARADGSEMHTEGRESQFLVLKDGEWKIAHIHYSQPKKQR
ncbi:nuclear transport factor 2 family protein [Cloacibacillus sp. An23]|uniref:nuclear transport factor 2 family protein n=1 Tax=Cloacibacillus sp. An23 TaxID=1965591 RepID=UPI000B3AF83D|nr:nuclear transport factor 2 family protein [Cloacibacillus sp. An23]OUO92826.1 hypothetical protein B5F39_10160 [Cloacibacillus sp. An23]